MVAHALMMFNTISAKRVGFRYSHIDNGSNSEVLHVIIALVLEILSQYICIMLYSCLYTCFIKLCIIKLKNKALIIVCPHNI